MPDEKIKISEKDFEEFMQKQGSKFFQIESDAMGAYGDKQMELFYKILDFTYKTLTVIALVAGFGFTGLDKVHSILLFVLGEGFLFAAIIYGLYWVQKVYESNLDALDKAKVRIKEGFAARNAAFRKIYNSYLEKKEVEKADMEDLTQKNNDLLQVFAGKTGENNKQERTPLKPIMILFIAGSILILFSFPFICTFVFLSKI
ncbi:MAG: hypothetical protein WEA04_02830 [Candidatus Andersenbacteria bacterium]